MVVDKLVIYPAVYLFRLKYGLGDRVLSVDHCLSEGPVVLSEVELEPLIEQLVRPELLLNAELLGGSSRYRILDLTSDALTSGALTSAESISVARIRASPRSTPRTFFTLTELEVVP